MHSIRVKTPLRVSEMGQEEIAWYRVKSGRRRFVAGTAAASAALVAAPFVRGAYAAGKLSVGFWDHWVPGANGATETLIKEWADKEKVDVTDRLHHLAGQQAAADDGGGSAGASRVTTFSP